MARDYKAEYAARNERARDAGWQSYSERRSATEAFNASPWPEYYSGNLEDMTRNQRDEVVKAFSMLDEDGRNRGHDSWHYYLFVELLEYMTQEEWDELYG